MKTTQRARPEKLLTRREATRSFLVAIGGAALYACASTDATGAGVSNTAANADSGDAGSTGNASDATTTATGDATGSATMWASGGTAAMVAAASYPDPFASAAAGCVLAVSVTEGPCTEAADQVRKDISEGYGGLPMRLALRFVDKDCNPIAGAKVKIWHTQLTGSYSGNTPNANMCLKSSAEASKHYFRGVQTTGDDGRVDFDSCFPGWYSSRTVHIHFTVTVDGKSTTSQLVFNQTLVEEIFASHVEYEPFGSPDTKNANDNVVGGKDLQSFVLTTARMTDGAMLAYKTIAVSS